MGKVPSASDEFLRLLTQLDEMAADHAGLAAGEIAQLSRGFVFVPSLVRSGDRASPNMSQWHDRLEWVGPEDEVPQADPVASESEADKAEAEDVTRDAVRRELDLIAAGLGCVGARTAAISAAIRRIYASRHHPDRAPSAQRPLATHRMMLANMMIDLDEGETVTEKKRARGP